jgi:hypothetical protein
MCPRWHGAAVAVARRAAAGAGGPWPGGAVAPGAAAAPPPASGSRCGGCGGRRWRRCPTAGQPGGCMASQARTARAAAIYRSLDLAGAETAHDGAQRTAISPRSLAQAGAAVPGQGARWEQRRGQSSGFAACWPAGLQARAGPPCLSRLAAWRLSAAAIIRAHHHQGPSSSGPIIIRAHHHQGPSSSGPIIIRAHHHQGPSSGPIKQGPSSSGPIIRAHRQGTSFCLRLRRWSRSDRARHRLLAALLTGRARRLATRETRS